MRPLKIETIENQDRFKIKTVIRSRVLEKKPMENQDHCKIKNIANSRPLKNQRLLKIWNKLKIQPTPLKKLKTLVNYHRRQNEIV